MTLKERADDLVAKLAEYHRLVDQENVDDSTTLLHEIFISIDNLPYADDYE